MSNERDRIADWLETLAERADQAGNAVHQHGDNHRFAATLYRARAADIRAGLHDPASD